MTNSRVKIGFTAVNYGWGINVSLYNVTSLTVCVCLFSGSQSEREEFETEYKEKYERERVLLTEENKKLSSELDKVKYLFLKTTHTSSKQVSKSCFLSFLVICLALSHTHAKKPTIP